MPRVPAHLIVETACRGHSVAAVLGSKGALAFDTPVLPADAEAWRKRVLEKAAGFAFVVQMDASPDRAFAAAHLPSLFGSDGPSLLAHQQTADALRSLQDSLKNNPITAVLESSALGLDPLSLRWPRPTVAFQKELTFHWDAEMVVLRQAPSGLPGSCWALLSTSNILLVGDTIAITQPPILQDTKFEVWLETLAELRKSPYKQCRLFCSHGGWLESDQVTAFMKFLQAAQKKVETLKSKESPQKEIPLMAKSLLEHFAVPADRRELALHRLQLGLQSLWESSRAPAAEKSGAG